MLHVASKFKSYEMLALQNWNVAAYKWFCYIYGFFFFFRFFFTCIGIHKAKKEKNENTLITSSSLIINKLLYCMSMCCMYVWYDVLEKCCSIFRRNIFHYQGSLTFSLWILFQFLIIHFLLQRNFTVRHSKKNSAIHFPKSKEKKKQQQHIGL